MTILEIALKRQPSGKYSREDVIHRIVFPLKTTSDDVSHDQHNLWIIDEKLSYHQYLASDKPLNKIQPIDSDFISRPDLLIFFNNAFATVDDEHPYNSGVVIFEFKRPMRDDYSENENPITQVLSYVKQIKEERRYRRMEDLFKSHLRHLFIVMLSVTLLQPLEIEQIFQAFVLPPMQMGILGSSRIWAHMLKS